MMPKKKNFLSMLLLILFFIAKPIINLAEDTGIGFEIQPIFPSTQIDTGKGYFYTQTSPGQEQVLQIKVFNRTDKDLTVQPIIENAVATETGNISYSGDLEQVDKSLKNPITEILIPEQETLTIPAKKDDILSFKLKAPAESYDGIKMGRIIVKKAKDKDEKVKAGISTEYQYYLGVITSENGDIFNDGQTLKLNNVKATINSGRKVVSAEIVNPEPKTIENLEVRSYVTKKGSDKKIKENNIDNFSLPPNAKLNFLVPWGLSNFEAGDYVFHFKAKNNYDSFEFEKEFNIRGSDAKKLNKDAAFQVNTSSTIKMIIIGLNAILFIISFIVIRRNSTWVKLLKSKKKGKNKGKNKGKKKRG